MRGGFLENGEGIGLETRWPKLSRVSTRTDNLLRKASSRAARPCARPIFSGSLPYPMADAIVKMGKYMATTMNPTVTPRNTIIIGSNSAVRLATASSTSSS